LLLPAREKIGGVRLDGCSSLACRLRLGAQRVSAPARLNLRGLVAARHLAHTSGERRAQILGAILLRHSHGPAAPTRRQRWAAGRHSNKTSEEREGGEHRVASKLRKIVHTRMFTAVLLMKNLLISGCLSGTSFHIESPSPLAAVC